MKNRFLWLLILGMALFTACSDDDDDKKAVTYNGENLSLSLGDFVLSGKEAVLDGAVLTVKKALPGEAETVFAVTRAGDKIMGNNTNTNREVTLDGTISGDKLSLNLIAKMKSSMTAKWSVTSLVFNLDTDQESVDFLGSPMPIDDFKEFIGNIGQLLPVMLPQLTLKDDGNIIARYVTNIDELLTSGTPIYGDSPEGMALYNVVDNKLYIALNINGIIADATSPKQSNVGRAESVNPLLQLAAAANEGLPLLMRKTDDGVDIYVNKEMMLPVVKMLPSLLESFGEQLGEYKELATSMVTMIVDLIENSNETEIGLHLVPYVEEVPAPAVMVLPQSVEKFMQKFAE
ncbi:DUF4925 domain-containing protein [Butyricimonas sp. Marseille-P3923]|uniref:DUF4925 domain-containing protein n=1 Tax=Butyricimonas sp. Marseille-P3923 TaxID=1987504 RepID=UPI000C06C271|nr:DUF4925 domain-containing protein [Butyricimonas sp. Marseille-P3923]